MPTVRTDGRFLSGICRRFFFLLRLWPRPAPRCFPVYFDLSSAGEGTKHAPSPGLKISGAKQKPREGLTGSASYQSAGKTGANRRFAPVKLMRPVEEERPSTLDPLSANNQGLQAACRRTKNRNRLRNNRGALMQMIFTDLTSQVTGLLAFYKRTHDITDCHANDSANEP